MVVHIVMWTLKDEALGADKAANIAKMKGLLEALPGLIPVIRGFKVVTDHLGTTAPALDITLYSEFDSAEDLQTYAVHPEHLKVVDFVKQVVATRAALDYVR